MNTLFDERRGWPQALADVEGVCGVGHCPYIAAHIRAFASSDPRLVFVVGALFLLVVVAAAALTLALRPLPSDPPCCPPASRHETADRDGGPVSTWLRRIARTLRLMSDVRFLLLIPSIAMMGVITSFAIGAFNQVQHCHTQGWQNLGFNLKNIRF